MKQPAERSGEYQEYRPKKAPRPAAAHETARPSAPEHPQQAAPAQNGAQERHVEAARHSQTQPGAPARESANQKKHSKYEADEDEEELDETIEALLRRQDLQAQGDGRPLAAEPAQARPALPDAGTKPQSQPQTEPAPSAHPEKKELTPPPGIELQEPPKPASQPREEPRHPIHHAAPAVQPFGAPQQGSQPQLPLAHHPGHAQAYPGQPLMYPGQAPAFYYPSPFMPQMAGGANQMMYPMMFGMPQPGPDGSAAALPQMMMMPQAGLQGVPGQPAGQQMPFMMPPGAMLYPGAMLPQVLPAHTGPSEPGTAASLLPDARHASAADVNGRPAAASSRLQIKQCN